MNIIKESKKDLVDNGGYDEIVIEDFYDSFLEAVEKLATLPKMYVDAKSEDTFEDFA